MEQQLMGRWELNDVVADRYRIVKKLGQGGMGAVYLAEDLKLQGKYWAIKAVGQINPELPYGDDAGILLQLNHPYLPTIIDYIPADESGVSHVVMDYIEGKTLQQLLIEHNYELPVEQVIQYSMQLCDLLHYLHTFEPRPIIYRDLKPSNMMVNEQNHMMLIDFGIAREYKIGQQTDTVPMGTIGFAAPEQFGEAQQTDQRTDLYNLGALMYYLLSKGTYYYAIKIPLTRYDGIPKRLAHLVTKLMQIQPEQRYQHASEVRKELEACLIFEKSESRQFGTPITVLAPQTFKKLIVIGSLYPRAGSSFTAIALARILNDIGIAHALVEYPTVVPALYALLYGDRCKPKDYVFLVDDLKQKLGKYHKEWRSGLTTWYPLNPQSGEKTSSWSVVNNYQLLYAMKSPITLVDVSTSWLDPGVQALCEEADEIVIVADARPELFNDEQTDRILNRANDLHHAGKAVHFIANRYITSRSSKMWLHSFPWEPLCQIPNISYEHMMQAIWREMLIQDDPAILPQLKQSLSALVKQLNINDQMKPKMKFNWRKEG